MKKGNIITLPNPRLRQKSEKVQFVSSETLKIINDMTDAVLDWEKSRTHEISAAISAVQINHLKKIVIVRSDFDDKSVSDFTALINPQIIKFEGEITKDFEGCLSVPDVYGMVPRYSKIRVKAKDINGNDVRFKADGFLARIIQHEVDHVNGIVFIDHIRDDKDAFFKLDKDGELQPLDYERYVKKNNILWD
ncbi:MAG: peptide deformylase [Candidatus Saccharibacteria bacterium]